MPSSTGVSGRWTGQDSGLPGAPGDVPAHRRPGSVLIRWWTSGLQLREMCVRWVELLSPCDLSQRPQETVGETSGTRCETCTPRPSPQKLGFSSFRTVEALTGARPTARALQDQRWRKTWLPGRNRNKDSRVHSPRGTEHGSRRPRGPETGGPRVSSCRRGG